MSVAALSIYKLEARRVAVNEFTRWDSLEKTMFWPKSK